VLTHSIGAELLRLRNLCAGLGIGLFALALEYGLLADVAGQKNPSVQQQQVSPTGSNQSEEVLQPAFAGMSPAPVSPEAATAASINDEKEYLRTEDDWDNTPYLFPESLPPTMKADFADTRFYLQLSPRHSLFRIARPMFLPIYDVTELPRPEPGRAGEWPVAAGAAEQSLATATIFVKVLGRSLLPDLSKFAGPRGARAGAFPNGAFTLRELLRAAVESRDPEVLFTIGEVQPLLNPLSTENDINRLAWWVVACRRGFNCSASAEWVRSVCGDTAPCASAVDSTDRLRMLAGDDWIKVRQLAREINSKLEAREWDELGLTSRCVCLLRPYRH
jgi:hypothetical protein